LKEKKISQTWGADYFRGMIFRPHFASNYTLIISLFLIFIFQSCSLVFPVIAPFDDLPQPTGPYSVLTRTTAWTDSTRDETFTPQADYRKIVVQVWFPTEDKVEGSTTFYVDDPALRLPALAKQLRLPVSLIHHFDRVKTNSYAGIQSSKFTPGFPIIIFSHGLSGMRFQNSSLMEELASQGYVVFAADHSYEANITIFPDGNTAEYRAGTRRTLSEDYLEEIDLTQLSIIVKDMSFMIDQIEKGNSDPFLRDLPLNLEHIGAVGHSLGGAAIINLVAEDERIDAAMALDTWYIPVPDSVLSSGIDKPLFHLGQKHWSDQNNYLRMDDLMSNSVGPLFKLHIPGTKHTDYTDMPLFSPFSYYIGYTGVTDPEWLNNLVRESTLKFFNSYLKDGDIQELKDLILSEKAVSSYIFIPSTPAVPNN